MHSKSDTAMTLKEKISEARIREKQQELGLWSQEPKCNPWQYSRAKASYPTAPEHIDYRYPARFLRTRLHEAVRTNNRPRVAELLILGANPWVRDRLGRTPLDVALNFVGSPELIVQLQDAMRQITFECEQYERDTGRRLGLRSQRRQRHPRCDDPTLAL